MSEFIVDGRTYQMVESKFTFAEGKAIERVTGHTFQRIFRDEELRESLDVLQALIWVSMKRVTPELKFSDLESLAIDDIEWVGVEEDVESDPTQLAEKAGEPSSS